MSNHQSLRQTRNIKLPSPFFPDRHHRLTISLHSTQRSGIFTPKFEHDLINRKKSSSLVCEKKLKARIMQIIGEKNQTIGNKSNNDIRAPSGNKYSRSYIHYKVICKEKTKDTIPPRSDTLMKIRSICESKLISLPQKEGNNCTRREGKQLCPVLPESPKVKIFTAKNPWNVPNLKHYRTESYEIEGKRQRSFHFQPWNNQESNEGDQLTGFLQL